MIKPKLLKVDKNEALSFGIRHEKCAYFDNPWHYHPELELTLITKSGGIRFVGDCVEQFEEGDLVLLGSNLPHYWRNSEEYYHGNSSQYAEAYILRFRIDLIERMILEIPETKKISQLLEKTSRGLWFGKEIAKKVQPLFVKMLQSSGTERIIGFLETMHQLSITGDYKILSSKSFSGIHSRIDSDRINKVLTYINDNLPENIPLDVIAAHVNMNSTAFCRYIKAQTNKTFVELLNDIRISNAYWLLLNSNQNISEISYECGFRNVTHFNYIFRKIAGQSPSSYRKKWDNKI